MNSIQPMIMITTIGMIVEFLGAVLLVIPDIPYVKSRLTPSTLQDARRELFNKTSLTEGGDNFDVILSTVRSKWDGELSEHPWLLLVDKPGPGMERSLFVVYDEESNGPYGDLRTDGGFQSRPDEFDDMREYVWENEKWDVVCAKQVLDDWVSEVVDEKTNYVLIVRGLGFVLFLIGFGTQLL